MKIKIIVHSIPVHLMNSDAIMDDVSSNHGNVTMKMVNVTFSHHIELKFTSGKSPGFEIFPELFSNFYYF